MPRISLKGLQRLFFEQSIPLRISVLGLKPREKNQLRTFLQMSNAILCTSAIGNAICLTLTNEQPRNRISHLDNLIRRIRNLVLVAQNILTRHRKRKTR